MYFNVIKGFNLSSSWNDYIPISYYDLLTPYQRKNSYTIVMKEKNNTFIGIARLAYISKNIMYLCDVFLMEPYRGKYYKEIKI